MSYAEFLINYIKKKLYPLLMTPHILNLLVVLSPYTFSICDTSGDEFVPYSSGGICTQVKTGKSVSSVSTCFMFYSRKYNVARN